MNIQAQMCGIILLVTMFLFYKRYQSLKLGTQIMFQVLLFGMLFCVICDMLSIWAIVRLLLDYRVLVLAVCKLYLISLVVVFPVFLYSQECKTFSLLLHADCIIMHVYRCLEHGEKSRLYTED